STDMDPEHTYALAGEIPVSLVSTSAYGCKDTVSSDIFFVSYKEAEFFPFQDSCSYFMTFAGVTDNAVSYKWDFGDGTISSEKNPRHRFAVDGSFSVKLTLNGEYNCVDSILKQVDFESPKGERVYVPNCFTPNGDGLNDRFRISMYDPCFRYSIRIFDRWGRTIYTAEDASIADWDGNNGSEKLPSGVYTWLLEGGQETRTGKVSVIY
ncbi:MAG: gliding motility-associated C-terminal domain-containing protein, partial [Bacteroidota bacterium]